MTKYYVAIIYLLTNLVNGKIYVGQTIKTLSVRWGQHVSHAKNPKSRTPISKAIAKYGPANFKAEILFACENTANFRQLLDSAEIDEIAKRRATHREFGYNICSGGTGGGLLCDDFGQKVSAGKLAAKTKRPDARAMMNSRSPEKVRYQARCGGLSIKGVAKTGEHGRRGSPTHPRASTYEIFDPEGNAYKVTNLSEFCRVHDLCKFVMCQTASSLAKVRTHKGGWYAVKIADTRP